MTLLETGKEIAKEVGELLLNRIETDFTVEVKDTEFDLVTEMDKAAEKLITERILAKFPTHKVLGEESIYAEPGTKPFLDGIKNEPFVWIIDPIDGTTNYIHGLPGYTISIGLVCEGEIRLGIINNPAMNEMFWAEKGKGAFLNGKEIKVSSTKKLSESVLATGFPTNIENDRNVVIKGINELGPLCRNIRVFGSAALHCAYVAAGRLEAYWEPALNLWDIAAGTLLVEEAGGTISEMDGTNFGLNFETYICSNGKIDSEAIKHLKGTLAIEGNS